MATLEQYYEIAPHRGKICCDNKGALYKPSREFRRHIIPFGASQADIKRALRSVKGKMKAIFEYKWVESYQDSYKLWDQLTLLHQLNYLFDSLAKNRVHLSLFP